MSPSLGPLADRLAAAREQPGHPVRSVSSACVPACGGARCQQRSERVGREEGGGGQELEPDTIGLIPPYLTYFWRWSGGGGGRGADRSGHERAIRGGGRHHHRGIRRKTWGRRGRETWLANATGMGEQRNGDGLQAAGVLVPVRPLASHGPSVWERNSEICHRVLFH